MPLIPLFLQIIIAAIILGLIIWLATQIPFVAPFANIIRVVAVTLFVIWIIYLLMELMVGGHILR